MDRLEQLKNNLKEKAIENLLIINPKNIRYLTAFSGDDSVLLICQDELFLITDGRYVEQAKTEVSANIQIIRWTGSIFAEVAVLAKTKQMSELYFEGDQLNYLDFEQLSQHATCTLSATQGLVEEIRAVKDEGEIATIQTAVEIVDQTFLHILNFIRPGITERAVATEIEYFMKCAGADGASFETIVASGVRSSYPHGEASDKVIELGDMITLDFGAFYQGYASDITRTIAVGQVDSRLEEIYYLVLEAEMNGLAEIKAGMTSQALDSIIREPIKNKEMNQYFNHGAGHSIGLDIHEAPYISQNSSVVFKENMIQTIEPGIYLPDLGGVRIEDDILVQKGMGKILTQSPKRDLIKLPFY